jgi:hypothetical protein
MSYTFLVVQFQSFLLQVTKFFFLEHAGELRIISLIEERGTDVQESFLNFPCSLCKCFFSLVLSIVTLLKGSPGAVVKLLPYDHEVKVLKTTSSRYVGKNCVQKAQSGWTLPRTLRKRELRAPGCPKCSVLGTEFLLSSRGRMTLGVGAIFWFISHTMPCQPKGLGLHIYSWPRQPSICQDASLRCCPKMLSF